MNAAAPSPTALGTEARRARQLTMLGELAELGMALARAAALRGLRDWEMQPGGDMQPAGDRQQSGEPQTVAPCADHALAFARLSRAVRQTLALEARIAEGGFAGAARRAPPGRACDPRFPVIRRYVLQAAGPGLDRAGRETAEAVIAEWLADTARAEPGEGGSMAEIILRVCSDLGIPFDPALLPDALLAPFGTDEAAGADAAAPDGTVAERTVRADTVRADTVRADMVRADMVRADMGPASIIPTAMGPAGALARGGRDPP